MEAIVEYNYQAQEPDELTINKGDIIRDIKVMLGGWWEGTLRDKRGMFPDNFVKLIEPSTDSANSSISNDDCDKLEVTLRNGKSGRRYCKALFSYDPCNEDELKLTPQDCIEFLGEVEEGWWKGRLRGEVGVFPSNFVGQIFQEEIELCRVRYPYEAANEDELTLEEGDIIKIISKEALDMGWWKGELKGQIGLFPDNFVVMLEEKPNNIDTENWWENAQSNTKSIPKLPLPSKKTEKANVRKSLDIRNDISKKPSISPLATGNIGGIGDRKLMNNQPMLPSKHVLGDSGNNSNNGNGVATLALGEELDEVERGEGAPLSHLTALRAKAPRRRPPSSQRFRNQVTTPTSSLVTDPLLEVKISNGDTEISINQLREEEGNSITTKIRKKAPWVEELKLNQLERRKTVDIDRVDRVDVRRHKTFARLSTTMTSTATPMTMTNVSDNLVKLDTEDEAIEIKEKEKNHEMNQSLNDDNLLSNSPGSPAFVPYNLYCQLLERVLILEKKQVAMEETIEKLSEKLMASSAHSLI